jgi:hypothetical protein
MVDDFDVSQGRDWVMHISVPNKVLKEYPQEVFRLNNTIQFELESFNYKIKKLRKEKEELRAKLVKDFEAEKKSGIGKKLKDAIVLKIQKDKEKEDRGY